MSYAYIKNVYPDFQASKVYDNKIYNSLDSINQANSQSIQVAKNSGVPAPYESDEEARFARSLLAKSELQQTQKPIELPQYKLLETLQNTPTEQRVGLNKDNLRFYNIPIPREVETFEEPRPNVQSECKVDCDSHINHVINCPRCKGIISRQLNLDNDRVRNEEFMELFSYIIFGIFFLLLIDSLKNSD